jgi:hypothetical protein
MATASLESADASEKQGDQFNEGKDKRESWFLSSSRQHRRLLNQTSNATAPEAAGNHGFRRSS